MDRLISSRLADLDPRSGCTQLLKSSDTHDKASVNRSSMQQLVVRSLTIRIRLDDATYLQREDRKSVV